jgi:hypothetical protein
VTTTRGIHRLLGATLALTLVVSGTGLPLPMEDDHEGDVTHIAAPHVGHGVALVSQELRLRQPVLPQFLAPEALLELSEPPAVRTPTARKHRILARDGRAPPDRLPRAPPA